MRVKCLAQEHNTGIEPGPLAPESSALTMRPPRLPLSSYRNTVLNQSVCVFALDYFLNNFIGVPRPSDIARPV